MRNVKAFLRSTPINPNVEEMEIQLFDYIADTMHYYLLDSEFWEILAIMNPELYEKLQNDQYPSLDNSRKSA